MRGRSTLLAAALGVTLAAVAVSSSCSLIAGSETISGNLIDAGASTSTTTTDTTTTSTNTSGSIEGLSCADRVLWRTFIEGTASDVALARDPLGDIVLAASVRGTVKVGPDTHVPLGGPGDQDILVVRYASNGSALWSKRYGGSGEEKVAGVTIRKDGLIVVAVNYEAKHGITNCDTGFDAGTANAAILAITKSGDECKGHEIFYGPGEIYDVTTTQDTNDLWTIGKATNSNSHSIQYWPDGALSGPVFGTGSGPTNTMSIASIGAVGFIAGGFTSTIAQEKTTILTSNGGMDAFLMRFSYVTDGTDGGVYGDGGVALGDDQFQSWNHIKADGTRLFVIGEAEGAANFSSTAPANGRDVIVSSRAPDFAPIWNARFGGSGHERGVAIAAAGGIVAIVGDHGGGFDIASHLDANDVNDVFVAVLATDHGTPLWSCSFGGPGEDHAKAVVVTPTRDVIAVGTFTGNATFGSEVDGGAGAIFVLQLSNEN